LRSLFHGNRWVIDFANAGGPVAIVRTPPDRIRNLHSLLQGQLGCLAPILDSLQFLKEPPENDPQAAASDASDVAPHCEVVFITHGRELDKGEVVARFVEKKLGLKAKSLHELPSRGRSLITKFQEEAAGIGFAVIVMTPDDKGAAVDEELKPRARQNV